jgi:hypothetical protein
LHTKCKLLSTQEDGSWRSVAEAIAALNSGALQATEGLCILFSASQDSYWLLWRSDKEEVSKNIIVAAQVSSQAFRPHAATETSLLGLQNDGQAVPTVITEQCIVSEAYSEGDDTSKGGVSSQAFRPHAATETSLLGLQNDGQAVPTVITEQCIVSEAYSEGDDTGKGGYWSLKDSISLGKEQPPWQILQTSCKILSTREGGSCQSVTAAVHSLNDAKLEAPQGLCILYSESQEAFWLLWRSDKKEAAEKMISIIEELQSSPIRLWSSAQTMGLGKDPQLSLQNLRRHCDVLSTREEVGMWRSVRDVIAALNESTLSSTRGICVIYSTTLDSYWLLWRSDKGDIAKTMIG